jgi:hypothetical protein
LRSRQPREGVSGFVIEIVVRSDSDGRCRRRRIFAGFRRDRVLGGWLLWRCEVGNERGGRQPVDFSLLRVSLVVLLVLCRFGGGRVRGQLLQMQGQTLCARDLGATLADWLGDGQG